MTWEEERIQRPSGDDEEALREYGRQLAMDGLLQEAISDVRTRVAGAEHAQEGPGRAHPSAAGIRAAARKRRTSSRRRKRTSKTRAWLRYGVAPLAAAAAVLLAAHLYNRHTIATAQEELCATVIEVRGAARLVNRDGTAVKRGGTVRPGGKVATGADGYVKLRYPDSSTLEIKKNSAASLLEHEKAKRIKLDKGELTADVTKQKPDAPMILGTANARAEIIGTRFTLSAAPARTRLEVAEGEIRLTRLQDKKHVDVPGGYCAVVAEGVALTRLPISGGTPVAAGGALFFEDFEGPRAARARWLTFTSGPADATEVTGGVLRMTPKNAAGGWHNWYAVTRQSFEVGWLRVTGKLRYSHDFGSLCGAVSLYDEADNGRGDHDHIELYLRNGTLSLRTIRYEGAGSKNSKNIVAVKINENSACAAGRWLDFELLVNSWHVVAFAGGRQIYNGPHKIAGFRRMKLGLYAGLKYSAQARSVEFDNIRVENLAIPATDDPEVTSLTLLDADTGRPVRGFDPLTDGAVISLATLPGRNLNVTARVAGRVGSVEFRLNRKHFNTERGWPYTLAVGYGKDGCKPWVPLPGKYTLEVIPWSGPPAAGKRGGTGKAGGRMTVKLRVTD